MFACSCMCTHMCMYVWMPVHVCGVWSWPQESIKMTISGGSQCHVLARAGRQGDDLSALDPGVVGLGR